MASNTDHLASDTRLQHLSFDGLNGSRRRTLAAAAFAAERQGVDVTHVLCDWIIEREALFGEIQRAAHPILIKAGEPDAGRAFADAGVGGLARRKVWRLGRVLDKARRASDWRVFTEHPMTLDTAELEELGRARGVIAAVHRWMHVVDDHSFTLAKAEKAMLAAMTEYDPESRSPDWVPPQSSPAAGTTDA